MPVSSETEMPVSSETEMPVSSETEIYAPRTTSGYRLLASGLPADIPFLRPQATGVRLILATGFQK